MAVLSGELTNGLGMASSCLTQSLATSTNGLGMASSCLTQSLATSTNGLGMASSCLTQSLATSTNGLGMASSCLTKSLATSTNGLGIPNIAFSIFTYQNLFREREYVNYRSRFARFFGENSKQDIEKIVINKADLPGLTPLIDNTAESIFIALLLHNLTYESNALMSTAYVETWKIEFIRRNSQSYVNHILLVSLLFISYQYLNQVSVIDYNLNQLPSYF